MSVVWIRAPKGDEAIGWAFGRQDGKWLCVIALWWGWLEFAK